MSAQDPSMMGYVYIIAGIALSIMGFVVYLMMRDQQEQRDNGATDVAEPATKEEEKSTPSATHEMGKIVGTPQRALLLHQDSSGKLIIEVDGKVYRNAKALRESSDWPLAENLSSELRNWLAASRQPAVKHPPKRSPPSAKESYAPESPNMVEEINDILVQRSGGLPEAYRGVRLIEGLDGNIKVMVGVEAFLLDEVPYEEVRTLISEAVSDWEKRN